MSVGEQQELSARACGRSTRSGRPCQNPLGRFEIACRLHASDHERELAKMRGRGYSDGLRDGYRSGEALAKDKIERLEIQVRELEQKIEDAARYYEFDGDQVVEVDGRYAYRWSGEPPLEVGEAVLLPENWLSGMTRGRGPYAGVVTKLGSTYRGPLSVIVARAPVGH